MPDDSRVVYVNGDYVAAAEAKVSVFDRGFLFGDGIYEVTAVVDGQLVESDAHLSRLARSAREIGISLPWTAAEIESVEKQLIVKNDLREGLVYLQVTRGVADRDFTYGSLVPSLVLFTQKKSLIESQAAAQGIAVKSVRDLRWARRDIKSVCLLPQVLAKALARSEGCAEAWMIDEDGLVTEGGSSTAYIVKNRRIFTRENSQAILPGCTRASLLHLRRHHAVEVIERSFSLEEAYAADEAFITSASSFVTPVISIDDRRIGEGKPGAVTKALRETYIRFARRAT